ncbi:MAG: hypothetical protein ABIK83_15880 [Candidatus Zixiibacteriota bacterium]
MDQRLCYQSGDHLNEGDTMHDSSDDRRYRLLVYGADKAGLRCKPFTIEGENYTTECAHFSSQKRFDEFDGVLVFQGAFESFETKHNRFDGQYEVCSCEKDQLDKRSKELSLLLRQGGFVCFILCQRIVDQARRYGSLRHTDLAKIILNYDGLDRQNFKTRVTNVHSVRDEFAKFLDHYGAACSYFTNRSKSVDWRVIAKYEEKVVSMILSDQIFFIPALLPEKGPEVGPDRIKEYFSELCDALIASFSRLKTGIPIWLERFKFSDEVPLLEEKARLSDQIDQIESKLARFQVYKRILLLHGDALVEAVARVLEQGFSLSVDVTNEYREDLRVIDADGAPILLAEIKGTNRGVKREHVNQADNHRERAQLPATFPTILIMNTNIKNSLSIENKDQEVANEQVQHADRNNVLILRTLDLLRLLDIYITGGISQEEILRLLSQHSGWLKIENDKVEIVSGSA